MRSSSLPLALTIAAATAFVRLAAADDVVPQGPLIETGTLRPSGAARQPRLCSWREPICVHGDVAPGALLRVLASAERAWEVETGPLALPAPDADPVTGAYDIYVSIAVPEETLTAVGSRDPRSRVDRASAFTLLDASLALGGSCRMDTAIASAVARAALFRASPATDEGSARAEAEYFARLAVPCAMSAPAGIDVFQSSPERAVMDPRVGDPRSAAEFDRGASLFYWWLDASFGGQPGGLVRALWALSATKTPPDAERWKGQPDGVDVLRESFKDALSEGSRLEDVLAEFGATRALLGRRENGAELREARTLGEAIAPRIDWEIDWPAAPRRLASSVGLSPTGSAYILVRRAGAPPGTRLRLEATWEQHAAIRWTAVKLDAGGHELGRIPIAADPRATEAQATLVNLDEAAAILIVATNVGDPFIRLDPDDEVFEPHGWLVTLARE